MLPTIKECQCVCSQKESDDSLILDGEMSDTDAESEPINTELEEVEKFIDLINNITNNNDIDKRIDELDREIQLLRTQVFQLQEKIDDEFKMYKYNYYIGAVFSASFAVSFLCLRRLRV
jgi:hypothetical protein